MKKLLVLLMTAMMLMGVAACGSKNTEEETENTKFELTYPESMKEQGFETLVLDEVPTRIVCASSSQVLTLYEMGASIVAMPSASATKHILEENSNITKLASLMSDDFNIENVVALNPDLVILSTSYKDSHGATLESLGINVYYQAAGHGVAYETVKEESLCLIEAFAVDEESRAKAAELKKSFDEIEETCKTLSKTYAGKKIMVLQIGGVGMVYGQTSAGTLGSMMNMLGFDNVSDSTAAASMFAIDYETALVEQPEVLVVVGSGDAAATRALMDEIIAANPEYWNAMTAVAENRILSLGIEYISVYGIGYVKTLGTLADEVAAFYAGE